MHKIGGAHLQCVINHYAKFAYKGMKSIELQITQTRHPKSVTVRQTEGGMDGWSGPTTGPAFA